MFPERGSDRHADARQDRRQDQRHDTARVIDLDEDRSARFIDRRKTDRRMLVIFAVVVVAFVAQSVRTEAQQHSIERTNHRISHQAYSDCVVRNESAKDLNKVLDQIIHAVGQDPTLSAAERTRRVQIYTSAKQGEVDCGDLR